MMHEDFSDVTRLPRRFCIALMIDDLRYGTLQDLGVAP